MLTKCCREFERIGGEADAALGSAGVCLKSSVLRLLRMVAIHHEPKDNMGVPPHFAGQCMIPLP
jgi:hypothetical protein